MQTLLRSYLQINTSNGDAKAYEACVALFAGYALRDGLNTRMIQLPSGYPVLIITLEGSRPELSALALNQHMDVVPAHEANWLADPFGGAVLEDCILGRGTQDMKGVGVVHYASLAALKRNGIIPNRTIHLLMVPDEERGGFLGTKQLIDHPDFKKLHIGYILDEGLASGNEESLLIKVCERTPLQISINSKGESAHGSTLTARNAAYELIGFLSELRAFHTHQQELAQSQQPGQLCSYQITSLLAGCPTVLNAIPAQATATVDIRVAPQIEYQAILTQLDQLCMCYPNLSYTVLATSVERMRIAQADTLFYQSLAQAIKENGYQAKPLYFEATTDTRFYTHNGIEGLGITPFTIKPALHSVNECIRLKDLEIGFAVLYSFLKLFCLESPTAKGTSC